VINNKDEIVEEVRAARNYELAAIYEVLKAKERTADHLAASLQPLEIHLHGVRADAGNE
jgi:hypothetical protein